MKQLEKMSLANAIGKLTRKEMSNIMAGSGEGKPCQRCYSAYDCGSGCNLCSGSKGRLGYCETYQ